MRVTLRCLSCVAWLACLSMLGCERERKTERHETKVGVLTGRVRLAEGAQLPAYASLDVARPVLHEHAQRAVPAECAAANEAARRPVLLTQERSLSGVVVAASDFLHFRERKPQLHRAAIEHCRLHPAVIAARGGDILELENRDAYGFEPLVGPAFRAFALASFAPVRFPLKPGVESILCTRAAPCGRADLVVFYHPVYALTDAHGEFHIDHFPASEQVRVTAWHPLFDESETYVWLEPGQHVAVELSLTPKKRFTVSQAP
jgi:hypothetical protein